MKSVVKSAFSRLGVSAFILVLVVACSLHAAQSQQKRIYLAPDDHTDYMWTGDENAYRKAILGMTDYYLDLDDKTEGNPPDFQSRWNFDGSLWMWMWENNRDHAQVERLVKRLRDGHISMPLTFAVSTYGAMPAEAALRSMYYAGSVERRYGLTFPLAIAMEDQTLPRGLGALFAGAGAKYSWRGVCACDTRMKPGITDLRPHEIYWWKGPDDSRILLKWYSVFPTGKSPGVSIGGYAEAWDPTAAVTFAENNPAFRKAYPYDVIGIFGEGNDNLATMNESFIETAKKFSNQDTKVIVSNEEDFFRDFATHYGSTIPEVSLGYGNEWDLYSESMPELSASVRRAIETLRPAEALATMVSLKDPSFYDARRKAREAAWAAVGLYWEHDWTSDSNEVPRAARAAFEQRTAHTITSYVKNLETDSIQSLGAQIKRRGMNLRYFVFNPLNWPRSDAADLPYPGAEDVHVVDLTTGQTVPSQFVRLRTNEGGMQRFLRIRASHVPSVGYKVYEIVPTKAPAFESQLKASGNTIENADYRVTVNGRGAVTNLTAKRFGDRELVSNIDGRLVNDWGSGSGTVSVINAGPVSITLQAKIDGPVPRLTEVTLFRDSDRIEIRNAILAGFSDIGTWSFSFHLQSPDVWHEEVGAINHAHLAPQGDYSPRFSRLEWLTLNHFAAMTEPDGVGVTLSNEDCAFMKLGRSKIEGGVSFLDTSTPQISVLAGGRVDGPHLGIPNLGGEQHFVQRFALGVYRHYDAASSMRFALEHQNPLVAGMVTGGFDYPEKSFSLFSSSGPDLLLWALKPSEEGIQNSVIARLWNMAPQARGSSVDFAGGISEAWKDTHVETDVGKAAIVNGKLEVNSAPWQLQTFRLKLPRASSVLAGQTRTEAGRHE